MKTLQSNSNITVHEAYHYKEKYTITFSTSVFFASF